MAPYYVAVADVAAELPAHFNTPKTTIEFFLDEAERRAKQKLGDPLPADHDVLKVAIRDYVVSKVLEKAYRVQSRELYLSARQLRQDSLDLMDEVDAEQATPDEPRGDKNVAYVRRIRL